MIVNQITEGWEVVYHRAHALLAMEIGARWRADARPAHWLETLVAISQHDDLEREYEGDHLGSSGAPLDFTLGEKKLDDVDGWREHIINAAYRSRWVALMTSMHVSFLNGNKRGESKTLDALLDELHQQQREWMQALKVKKGEAEAAYAFLQWCDRLSLILGKRQLPSRERFLEISDGPDGVRYDIMQRADETVCVEPWPFEEREFTLVIEARTLTQMSFANNDELTTALKDAPIHLNQWRFVK